MSESPADQPTLTDGVVTLRPWQDRDVESAITGPDEGMAQWFGFPSVTPAPNEQHALLERWRRGWAEDRELVSFAIEHEGEMVGGCTVRRSGHGVGELSWALSSRQRGRGLATHAVQVLADYALTDAGQGGLGLHRVEARIEPLEAASLRVATRSGLRREGVRRVAPGTGDRAETTEYVILARLASDPPINEPEGFRSLLNSFLPRKRAIGQMLIRDTAGRVLLCRLTYKRDWDLPGGVVEVGESPREAVGREVTEELGLTIEPGALLLTDWLPPWGGWDDAICLVFDGGTHDPAIVADIVEQAREIHSARFCTMEEVREHCADYTTRRIEAALDPARAAYTESGR